MWVQIPPLVYMSDDGPIEYKDYGPYSHNAGYPMMIRVYKNGKKETILKHRVVMEEHLGRKLGSDEIVHHKNENKLDYSLENLELVTREEHGKHHAKCAESLEISCLFCGITFITKNDHHFRHKKKKHKGGCCSKSCSGRLGKADQLGLTVEEYKKKYP